VAVIGAGIVGLATARALERRGFTCLLFEQGAPGGGQSAGESRIFRHAHNDPRQFELAVRARRDWKEWEAEFGVQLISPDGAMAIGAESVSRLEKYADDPAVRVREMTPEQVTRALPILAGYDGPALIDDAAGAILTRLTIAHLIESVGPNLVPERVESVVPRPEGGVEVTSSFGSRDFDAVVVAAGTGTPALAASADINIPSEPRAHVRLTFPLASGVREPRLACIQDSSGAFGEAAAYGSPVRGNRSYAVGLALSAEVDSESPEDPLSGLAERTRAYVREAMPGLDPDGAVPFQRWITELPWAADGLAIWQEGDAYFVAGHNLFKLAPALGRTLADSVVSGMVEPGFRPEARLGAPALEAR
ncbi:MAG TPA: FAD-binding oxidoreductase, partial [Solirubrobacterales bacterium]|nr:FAD-binding oxidoreductase [Solirubrobacterales bacterium]